MSKVGGFFKTLFKPVTVPSKWIGNHVANGTIYAINKLPGGSSFLAENRRAWFGLVASDSSVKKQSELLKQRSQLDNDINKLLKQREEAVNVDPDDVSYKLYGRDVDGNVTKKSLIDDIDDQIAKKRLDIDDIDNEVSIFRKKELDNNELITRKLLRSDGWKGILKPVAIIGILVGTAFAAIIYGPELFKQIDEQIKEAEKENCENGSLYSCMTVSLSEAAGISMTSASLVFPILMIFLIIILFSSIF